MPLFHCTSLIRSQEAGQQHVDLLEAYNNVLEEFEKRYGMLVDVQIRTQLKIRQVTGLRDGVIFLVLFNLCRY